MKTSPLGTELFHAGRHAEANSDFGNFANALRNGSSRAGIRRINLGFSKTDVMSVEYTFHSTACSLRGWGDWWVSPAFSFVLLTCSNALFIFAHFVWMSATTREPLTGSKYSPLS